MVGNYNSTEFLSTTSPPDSVSVETTAADNQWVFNAQIYFGVYNTTLGTGDNATQAYDMLTNTSYNTAKLATNYGGIGMPPALVDQVRTTLNSWSNDIWTCGKTENNYCSAPVWCNAFNGEENSSYNYTDVNFKIKLSLSSTKLAS